jgi:hypothetical protein
MLTIVFATIFLLSFPFYSYGATSMIPLDKNSYAFHRGNLASKVNVEFFIDLTCSSCLDSWPTLNKVVETYKNDVHFLYRLFPLPYHQQGFIVNKAAHVVNFYGNNSEAVFHFFDVAFDNQGEIYTSTTADMTYNQVVNLVSDWAVDGTGLSKDQYFSGMNSSTTIGSQLEMATRYMWKYTTLHSVFATPFFYVQGLEAGGLDTFDDWVKTLDPLIGKKI